MKPRAPATGHAGTERPPSNFASGACFTTRRPMPATGLRTWAAARSTVSSSSKFSISTVLYHLPLPSLALCKDDPNGNVPLGKSCNRYWACQGGYPRLQRCPAMLVFDKERKRCVSPPTADCDVPTTTPQPEDEQQEGGQDEDLLSGPPRRPAQDPRGPPENRRRFQQQSGLDGGNQPLPFDLPSGATLLNRPPPQ